MAATQDEMARLVDCMSMRGPPRSPPETTSDSNDSQDDVTPRNKKRKPTYYVRKEEKVVLEKELAELQEKIRTLETTQHTSAKRALDDSMALNALLSADVEVNNLALAGAQSMLSAEMVSRFRNPMDKYIYLPDDPLLRRASLHSLKSLKVETALRLLHERTRFVDIRQPHRHSESTVLKNGDYVLTYFDITPFDGCTDPRVVFELFQSYVMNQEISVSEHLGILSIRETDDEAEAAVTQCRFLTTIAPGVDVESNLAMCARFFDQPDETNATNPHAYGVGTVDYIDKDDRYPYQSSTRIRKDLSACALITQTTSDPDDVGGVDDHGPSVSMVRFATVRLRFPEFPLAKHLLAAARTNAEQWCEVMPRAMKERLGIS